MLPEIATLPFMWEGFLFAAAMMALQAGMWCGVGILISLISRSTTAAAFLTFLACLLAPPALTLIFALCLPVQQPQWAWFPLQEQVYDAALGLLNVRAVVSCLSITAVVLYAAGLLFDAHRICGKER